MRDREKEREWGRVAEPESYILDVGINTNENFKRKLTER